MSLRSSLRDVLSRPYLRLIALIGVIVPHRLRAEWREEWEAELGFREQRLSQWNRLDAGHRRDLLRRSTAAIWDALWLQRHRWEDEIVQDVRFALRMVFKQPTIAFIAVATLALGIGANTAVFSVVNALLLRPLQGVSHPERLVQIGRQYPDKTYVSDSSYPDFVDFRAQASAMSDIAVTSVSAFHVTAGADTARVDGEFVSGGYFDVLGATAAQGRLIAPADDTPNAEPVAVIGERLWRSRFGAARDIADRPITLNGQRFAVIGVARAPFAGIKIGTPRDVWVPLAMLPRFDPGIGPRFEQRRASWLEMFGRLAPGASLDQAREECSAIAQRLEQAYPDSNSRVGAAVNPDLGRDVEVQGQLRRFALLPFAAVASVLLIACANVASLLLARAATRRKEMATRFALGARRARIIRQLLTESIVLAVAGGAGGLLVGGWLTGGLRSLLPERYLFLSFDLDFGIDWRVFAFTLVVASLTAILFGVVPALQASRTDVIAGVKNPHGFGRSYSVGLRGALVIGQVALSLVLLVAAILCVRTLRNAAAIDTGYESARVLTARIDLARQAYTETRGRLFQQQLVERIGALPGVEAAGLAVTLPLNDSRWEDSIRREGDTARVQAFQNVVSTSYFDAMRIPLLIGRHFSGQDDERAPRVAILNQALAQLLWPGESPIGRRLTFKGRPIEVVGIVRDIKGRDLFAVAPPMLYLPLAQQYQANVVLHVRSTVPPTRLVTPIKGEVSALDEDLPVYAVKTLHEHVTATLTPQRLLAYLVSGFALLALVLSIIGLYALLAYAVGERTKEIGIRMALGAHRAGVIRLIAGWGLRLALAGIVLGVAAAAGLTHLMRSLLYGVSPLDPFSLTTMPILLFLAALLACVIPAWRASRADPKVALRYE